MNSPFRWPHAIAVAVACYATPAAVAWNDRGHMLTAMVAYQDLKPEVRDGVNAILKEHPQYDLLKEGEPVPGPDQDLWVFAKAATWPDMVRSTNNPLHGAEHHAQWHFIDYPYSLDSTKGPAPVEVWNGKHDPSNLLQALTAVTGELEARSTRADRRAIALCWAEHLIGDIHQPLHAVSMFSATYPKGDNGGNSFAIKRGETPSNLHSYWDNVLGKGTSLDTLKKQIEGFHENPELTRAKLMGDKPATDATAWARESSQLAEDEVYLNGKLKGVRHSGRGDYPADTPALPADYEEKAKHLAAKRVVLAGYRMADALNAELAARAPAQEPALVRDKCWMARLTMKSLAHRLIALERRLQPKIVVETLSDRRRNWPARFAAHTNANADLLHRIRRLAEEHAKACVKPDEPWMDTWDILGVLYTKAAVWGDGYDSPEPAAPVEAEARAMLEEFTTARGAYEESTGDLLPLPGR